MENKFSGNYLQLTECFEGFDPEMVWSENFHFKPFPNSHAKTEEREPSTSTSPITAFDFDFANLRTHRSTNRSRLQLRRSRLWLRRLRRSHLQLRQSTNPRTDLQPRAFDPQTFDFTDDQEPSRHKPIFDPSPSTQSHEPTNRSLSLSVIFIFCVILIDPRTFDLWFFVVVVVVWVVVFWWFSCCVVVGFGGWWWKNSIFRMLPNIWKYFLEQFS